MIVLEDTVPVRVRKDTSKKNDVVYKKSEIGLFVLLMIANAVWRSPSLAYIQIHNSDK